MQRWGFLLSSSKMGISRDSWHKRRHTGGRKKPLTKKRKHCLGRPSANTKLGTKRIHTVRCRGGNLKFRAMRLVLEITPGDLRVSLERPGSLMLSTMQATMNLYVPKLWSKMLLFSSMPHHSSNDLKHITELLLDARKDTKYPKVKKIP